MLHMMPRCLWLSSFTYWDSAAHHKKMPPRLGVNPAGSRYWQGAKACLISHLRARWVEVVKGKWEPAKQTLSRDAETRGLEPVRNCRRMPQTQEKRSANPLGLDIPPGKGENFAS